MAALKTVQLSPYDSWRLLNVLFKRAFRDPTSENFDKLGELMFKFAEASRGTTRDVATTANAFIDKFASDANARLDAAYGRIRQLESRVTQRDAEIASLQRSNDKLLARLRPVDDATDERKFSPDEVMALIRETVSSEEFLAEARAQLHG